MTLVPHGVRVEGDGVPSTQRFFFVDLKTNAGFLLETGVGTFKFLRRVLLPQQPVGVELIIKHRRMSIVIIYTLLHNA